MEATNLIHMESFVILRMLYKWNPTECNFLGLDKFIQCNSVDIHLGFVVSVVLFLLLKSSLWFNVHILKWTCRVSSSWLSQLKFTKLHVQGWCEQKFFVSVCFSSGINAQECNFWVMEYCILSFLRSYQSIFQKSYTIGLSHWEYLQCHTSMWCWRWFYCPQSYRHMLILCSSFKLCSPDGYW